MSCRRINLGISTYDEAIHNHGIRCDGFLDCSPASRGEGRNSPGNSVSKSFQYHDASEPSVQQVESIKRETNPVDQDVVTPSHDE